MKASAEDHDIGAFRGLLGELDRRFGDLRSGVGEEELLDTRGGDLGQLRRQRLEQIVLIHVDLGMNELLGLICNCLDDTRVCMASRVDGDAAGEVEVLLTLRRCHPRAVPTGDLQRSDRKPDI